MKRLSLLVLILIILSGCSNDNYPEEIKWEGRTFVITNEFYSEEDIDLVKIGTYKGYEIYEEKEIPYNSKFIKTDKGFLHYKIEGVLLKKPNIYLYPEVETNVEVSIKFNGEIISTYPRYNDGWKVIAKPDGTIINSEDGREYSYLFWEGRYNTDWDLSKGYVVKGEDTAEFLQEKLSYMGLIPSEYNEFIVYWFPEMEENKYNFITFVNEQYSEGIKLDIDPKPDSVIRVFMVYKPLNKDMKVEEPKLKKYDRKGFTLVEWGGARVD